MRVLRHAVVAGCLIFVLPGFTQKQDWLPIPPKDWAVKEVPGDPGASAIQLYYAEHNDDHLGTKFFYHRIKILTERALQPGASADVEIPMPPDTSVGDLKARTVHPDGSIIEFSGKPFEKTVIKGRGIKFLAKTFTFPQATVGSILEYKYVLNLTANLVFIYSDWTVQHSLYTLKESLSMTPYLGELTGFPHGFQVSVLSTNMPKALKPVRKGSGWELTAENIPAFVSESFMPPENNYKPQVRFYYTGYQPQSDEKYWRETGKTWYEEGERFIGKRGEIKTAAASAIGTEADPEKILRKLYARVQQIRNLSFERERMEEEQKKENLKPNENAGQVLDHGYGSHTEINRLFVALARAAGFEASILPVSDRKENIFTKSLQLPSQFPVEIALIKLKGADLYLDPGTRFCPFGLLRWMNTSSQSLRLDSKEGTLILTPPATQDKAVIRRSASVVVDSVGALKGAIAIQYKGGEGLERRLEALNTDEAGRKKTLEDELKGWLPSGAVVKFASAEGWEGSDDPLSASFTVEIPGYASTVGKRLILPAYLFQSKQMSAFKLAERKYPVYFPYAFAEIDSVSIKIPAGYTMESLPQKQETGLKIAKYQSVSQFDGSQLVTQRGLLFNAIYMPPEMYPEIKGFFNKVQAGDEQQAVLQEGGVHAQASH